MATISEIRAREIIDSRGNPTVEADVILSDGSVGRAAVPSGASTGKFEALELRDKDPKRYNGNGVLKAIENIKLSISPHLIGIEASDQESLDQILIDTDGTPTKSNLGANSILAISLANAKANAKSSSLPLYESLDMENDFILPVPMLNIINGGKHANDSTDIQEFMVIPAGFETFSESIRAGCEVYHSLHQILTSKNLNTSVGDEGGFAPRLTSNQAALDLITESVDKAGYSMGEQFFIGLDVAASELFDTNNLKYNLEREDKIIDADEIIELYHSWIKEYPILSIEDGLSEDEWNDWTKMTKLLGNKVQIVGDDLLTTNPERINRAIKEECGNSVLVKPNQIGTLSETLIAIYDAKKAGWGTVMSHRSGETEDTTIADLAVATGTAQIKTGAPSRGERTSKYNRLLRIEEELGNRAKYAGLSVYQKYLNSKEI